MLRPRLDARARRDVVAFTADLAQPDEPAHRRTSPIGRGATAPRRRVLVDCREALVREGLAALQCGAFHLQTAASATSTRRRSAARSPARAHPRDARGRGRHLLRRSTHKGNDIERFFRYGVLVNPALAIYKPWLDAAFVDGARRTQGDERVARRARPAHGTPARRPTRPTRTCSARRTRPRTWSASTSMRIVEPIMGVATGTRRSRSSRRR